jgi:RimJ/RimL family protein N-acetyltransferase
VSEIRIVSTDERYAEGFHAALDIVARERKYIGFVEGPPVENMRKLIADIIDGGGVQMLALTPGENVENVVGWCDILRVPYEGFRHVGRLGMGLLPEYRGHGLGRRLATETIEAARRAGIERVELEVFASNAVAIALYLALGFVVEGTKRNARKLDGQYDDNVMMALIQKT